MIKAKNTINREELKAELINDFNTQYEEVTSFIKENNYDNSYKEKFENLYKKYELAQEERQEIE